jgi:hypothetical protein
VVKVTGTRLPAGSQIYGLAVNGIIEKLNACPQGAICMRCRSRQQSAPRRALTAAGSRCNAQQGWGTCTANGCACVAGRTGADCATARCVLQPLTTPPLEGVACSEPMTLSAGGNLNSSVVRCNAAALRRVAHTRPAD